MKEKKFNIHLESLKFQIFSYITKDIENTCTSTFLDIVKYIFLAT